MMMHALWLLVIVPASVFFGIALHKALCKDGDG